MADAGAQIAELFQTTPQNVTLHLKAIFEEGELEEEATCKDYLQVRFEGGARCPACSGTIALGPFWPSATGSASPAAPNSAE